MRKASSGRRSVLLGISADYHDAAACLVIDGTIVAAAEEERFTRRKHDPSLPRNAMRWCLEHGGIRPGELDAVAFYAKPLTTYERILVSHAKAGPRAFVALTRAIGTWMGTKLWTDYRIEEALEPLGHRCVPVAYAEHHASHAASAFYPSPFEEAAVITADGVGEWTTGSIAHGRGDALNLLVEQRYPDSLGLFYSAMTAHCGFSVNDGEYKLMGLAPYGQPRYVDTLRDHVIKVHEDGSVRLDLRAFSFIAGRRMGSRRMDELIDGPPRHGDDPLGQREADIACSAQVIVEDAVLAMAQRAHDLTGSTRACLAGGVALNCVATMALVERGPFSDVWTQPAAGDAGGAIGAALWLHHSVDRRPRRVDVGTDAMGGSALGPSYSAEEVVEWLDASGIEHARPADHPGLCQLVAEALADGHLVGWFDGPMEFGPRALGHRSILADPRDAAVVHRLNDRVKRREGFRPFAPSVLVEHVGDWFDGAGEWPYMTVTARLANHRRRPAAPAVDDSFAARLGQERSEVPACTHIDGTARVHTVDRHRNPRFHELLQAFEARTRCPVLLNTSFNGPGEPIVCTPAQALATALGCGLDVLVVEGCVVRTRSLTHDPERTATAGAS